MSFDILQYDFMRRAFLVGILLAVIIPCIGVIVVFKRLSLIGDALSHTSLQTNAKKPAMVLAFFHVFWIFFDKNVNALDPFVHKRFDQIDIGRHCH